MPVEAGCAGLRDERTNGRRGGDADRVRKDDVRPAGEARCELDDDAGIDMSFEGTAEADGNRHRMGILPTGCQDGLGGRDRLGQAHVPVRLVEALGRAEGDVHPVEPARREALPAALVQDEPGVLDTLAALDLTDDLLRAGHGRNAVVADEAHRLDPRQARSAEPVDELGAHGRRERVGLVLEAVARADLAERDVHGGSVVGGGEPPPASVTPRAVRAG